MKAYSRYPVHAHEQMDKAVLREEDDLAELDRLVDVTITGMLPGADVMMTHGFGAMDQDLWQDMNKPDASVLSAGGSNVLRWRSMGGIPTVSSSNSSSGSKGETPQPQRVGSCDEYETALLRADAFTVEDQAGVALSADEDASAQDAEAAAPLDASFFTKFAISIMPESCFGIDGTGAGVGVGASYYEGHYDDGGIAEGGEGDEAVELNNRGAPRRKRKLSRSARSDWDLEDLMPLYSGGGGGGGGLGAGSGSGRRQLPVVGGSSTGSSKRSDSDSVGSDEMEQPFSFLHNSGRGSESKSKRQSRGKYKCSRCGEQKNSHTCSVMSEVEITVSVGTQCQPAAGQGMSIPLLEALSTGTEMAQPRAPAASKTAGRGLFETERVLVVRPWKGSAGGAGKA